MKVRISPGIPSGVVTIPASKSMSHRAIICACLANGESVLKNISYSDDIVATISCMRHLGALIEKREEGLFIRGIGGVFDYDGEVIDCRESGSTLRFLIPIFSLTEQKVTFSGSKRLFERPMDIYKSLFAEKGVYFSHSGSNLGLCGALPAGIYEVDGGVSSQFISGLLFLMPLLNKDSVIKIKPPFESSSYVALTISALNSFGIDVQMPDNLTIIVKGGQSYKPSVYTVEGDYSQLGFFAVLGSLKGGVACYGLNHASKQGDRVIIDILERAGALIDRVDGGFVFHKSSLKGMDINLADCPDLGPVLSVMAMFSEGATRIYNAGRLRLKECDRISAMAEELLKAGVDFIEKDDEYIINGKGCYTGDDVFCGHNDHRVVMSLAVMALMLDSPVIISGAEAVAKSYPDFFDDLAKLNLNIEFL